MRNEGILMIFNTDNQKYSGSAKESFTKFVNIELKYYLCSINSYKYSYEQR